MLNNRETYKALLAEYRISQAESAALICEHTQRPCSVRTVRTWLNNPDSPHSRPCPDWAVKVLREALVAKSKAVRKHYLAQESFPDSAQSAQSIDFWDKPRG